MKRFKIDIFTSMNTFYTSDIEAKSIVSAVKAIRILSTKKEFPITLYGYNNHGWTKYHKGKVTENSIRRLSNI